MRPPPRLVGNPARAASVVAVLRRGPSDWTHVARWDVDALTYVSGSWLHGTLYPQRCAVSPDGRWLCYVALKTGGRWSAGSTYVAVSRLPWLTAPAAWAPAGRGPEACTCSAGPVVTSEVAPLGSREAAA